MYVRYLDIEDNLIELWRVPLRGNGISRENFLKFLQFKNIYKQFLCLKSKKKIRKIIFKDTFCKEFYRN